MQRELFKDFGTKQLEDSKPTSVTEYKPSFFEKIRWTLTLDKVVLWSLMNITAVVFVYSFGVEQGMKHAKGSDVVSEVRSENTTSPDGTDYAERSSSARPSSLVEDQDSLPAPTEAAGTPEKLRQESAANSQGITVGNRYTIQLVTYVRADRAKQEIARLSEKGHKAFLIPSGKYYQVCVEEFWERRQAFQKLIELRMDGYSQTYRDAYVRPLKQ